MLPGINDGFAGRAPDVGAYELGEEPPHYGIRPEGKEAEIDGRIGRTAGGGGAPAGGAEAAPGAIGDAAERVDPKAAQLFRTARQAERAGMNDMARTAVYFGEDQPYTGLADAADWKKTEEFLKNLPVDRIDYPIDAYHKVDLIWRHYPTQVEESYRQGILNRANQLQRINMADSGVERIYRLL